jgi:pimeloyl-ACP methyl ester carboxylesterase
MVSGDKICYLVDSIQGEPPEVSEYLVALYAATSLLILLPLSVAFVAYRKMLRIRRVNPESIERISLEKCEFPPEILLKPWMTESLRSKHGYDLKVHALPGSITRLAIFHHGVSWNWMGAIKYMAAFIDEGWTVVSYDSRGHGESGGGHPSYGFFEKDDLLTVADWALARYPFGDGFIVHGESLGGATVLQYAALDSRPDAVIADCPFSSAAAELDHRLSGFLKPGFIRAIVVSLVDFFARKIDGFSLFDADSSAAIVATGVPVLFIHGREDVYVPWMMSLSMAGRRRKALPKAITEFILVPGARHAASYNVDPAGYNEAVLGFIRRVRALKGTS